MKTPSNIDGTIYLPDANPDGLGDWAAWLAEDDLPVPTAEQRSELEEIGARRA